MDKKNDIETEKTISDTDAVAEGSRWKFSKSVWLFLISKILQIFAFVLQAVTLTLFIIQFLHYSPSTAASIYHGSAVVLFLSPLIAGVAADTWTGRYNAIIIFMTIQAIGSIVYTAFASPAVKKGKLAGIVIALMVSSIGSGGLKPVTSAFGADQFRGDRKYMDSFFSVYYMSVNIGALLGKIIGPLMKEIKCFKPPNDPDCMMRQCPCYVLIYGIAALILILANVIFMLGSKQYVKNRPEGAIATKFVAAIVSAIKNRITRTNPSRAIRHWLDYASDKYDDENLSNFRQVLRIILVIIPLSMYWSLFSQTGSTWVIQGTQMNAKLGKLTISEDILQAANPLLIIILAPIFESVVYPAFARCHLLETLIERLITGLLTMGLAYVIVGILQIIVLKNPLKINGTEIIPLSPTTFSPPNTSLVSMATIIGNGTLFINQARPFKSTVHIMWQIIPYFLLSCSETMFGVSALHFAYAEAPKSMAAMVSAFYLLTPSLGNIVTLIINALIGKNNVAPWVFFLYAGLIVAATIIFAILAKSFVTKKAHDDPRNVQITKNEDIIFDGTLAFHENSLAQCDL